MNNEHTNQTTVSEPFGYFKAEPFGWTDCEKDDEGAIALYERPPSQPVARDVLIKAINEAIHECRYYGYDAGGVFQGWPEGLAEKIADRYAAQPPAVAVPQAATLSAALADIAAERRRQVEVEGWTPEHDDAHSNGQMAVAAASYAMHAHRPERIKRITAPMYWPWAYEWFKATTARRDLVKAGALIAAEIERLDRAAQKGGEA